MFNFFNGFTNNSNNHIINKVNFEDVQTLGNNGILINTMPQNIQDCLITGTITVSDEEKYINKLLSSNKSCVIIVYGKNSNDDTIYKKYEQLKKLGFINAKLYIGGLFEWLLLQDIYGDDEFKTTKKELDILKFKPQSNLSTMLVTT
jgi:hypothetical protein